MDKLHRLQRQKMGGPDVISRGRKRVGDLEQAQASRASGVHEVGAPGAESGETPVKSPAAAPVATSGVQPQPTGPSSTDRWRELTAKLGWRDGKPYNAARTYKPGDVLLHKALGLGVVQEVVNEGACMVLFRDKETVLEMAQPDNS